MMDRRREGERWDRRINTKRREEPREAPAIAVPLIARSIVPILRMYDEFTKTITDLVGTHVPSLRLQYSKSTMIGPHIGHPMRCCLDHDDRF